MRTAIFIFDSSTFRKDFWLALRGEFTGLSPSRLTSNLSLTFLGLRFYVGATVAFIICNCTAKAPEFMEHNVFGAAVEMTDGTIDQIYGQLQAGWLPKLLSKPTLQLVQRGRKAA